MKSYGSERSLLVAFVPQGIAAGYDQGGWQCEITTNNVVQQEMHVVVEGIREIGWSKAWWTEGGRLRFLGLVLWQFCVRVTALLPLVVVARFRPCILIYFRLLPLASSNNPCYCHPPLPQPSLLPPLPSFFPCLFPATASSPTSIAYTTLPHFRCYHPRSVKTCSTTAAK
ncbi:hypothetical protein BHE74_00020613 [Ensete ventricosum]|nr:hypothetical protein BHE74_00020613 [Ensete ventricosum]